MNPARRARRLVRRLLRKSATDQAPARPAELAAISDADRIIAERVRGYTMTGPVRLQSLLDAVAHVTARRLPGAFVECGVWRGGSVMAMLLKLMELHDIGREVFLYDTFGGMTEPTAEDVSAYEPPALTTWRQARESGRRAWDRLFNPNLFSEEIVRAAMVTTGYPVDKLHFVKGPVEETIPDTMPDQIALLRLDTDWYASTRHELEHLYPRLVPGGILIIDDYGHWDGCRQAVDEYFSRPDVEPLLLQRIDYTGRLAVRS